ncbi:MAG: FAD-binding protein, partial [Pseudomonadales bacterium]|nr:FAD-binding protein [Pseudomonadales bacterium]
MTVLSDLCQAVRVADSPLLITGGGSRLYPYASLSDLKELSLSSYSGIIEYFPEELVVRVKSGTRLDELISSLSEQGQMLGSEP